MKNHHKLNWIKGFSVVIFAVAVLAAVAVGIIFDGRDPNISSPPQSSVDRPYGFDLGALPKDLRTHAEECHHKGMLAGRIIVHGTITAIKCYEE